MIVTLEGFDGHPYRIADNAETLARGAGQLQTITLLRAMAHTEHEISLSLLMTNQSLTDPRSALSRITHLIRSGALTRCVTIDCPICSGDTACELCEGLGSIHVPSNHLSLQVLAPELYSPSSADRLHA
jgi:hypothetical protein